MENKIKHKILYPLSRTLVQVRRLIERLFAWLHSGPVIIDVRPIHRDIHLNSSAAISIWLAMLDRPLSDVTLSPMHAGVGTSLDEEE